MTLRSIQSLDFSNKKVCVRVDFNIELTDIGKVEEHFRIDIVKETLAHIASFPGVKIALLAHYGRPEGKKDEQYSLVKLVPFVETAIQKKVIFVPDCIGEAVEQALATLSEGSILLLENTRFYPGEESNDPEFASALAKPFDLYINEAFSVCHRDHASITGIPKLLPSAAGFRLEKEIAELDRVRLKPEHPAVAIIGGAKIETKLPLIRAFEPTYDCVLVGGKIANEALDQKIEFSDKVLLPTDFGSADRFDIGPNTIAYYTQILKMAKTIVWNGPMGKFEEKPYHIGTECILNAILETEAHIVIGGGESLAVVEKANVMSKIDFVSSGGGAMLEYLSGKSLPGLEALSQ
ncbi:MAG: phosphoglycerate kinase [Patescibacteria group bacterium]